ncbi:hypothetical protein [Salipiger bermudensis]|uniref:hypothetical protein n=1 Tax=Salipiger bermudensis TaxID=344736 RepID=UPI0028F7481A|nr:hypothetical protein [Salipiger bermudensis]
MADEKKPVDGTEEQGDEAKTPETELSPETAADAVVTEEDDAGNTLAEDGDDTPAGAAESGDVDEAETVASGDDSLAEEDSLSAAGDDSISDDDTLSAGDDSIAADMPAGDDTLEGDDQIHSAGEAELLAEAEKGDETVAVEPEAVEEAPAARSAGYSGPVNVVRETVVERKASLAPMLLGGVIAAVLGFGASSLASGGWPFGSNAELESFRTDTAAALDEQTTRIDALAAEVQTATDTANGIDLSALEAAVEALRADLDAASGSYDALAGRIDAIERRPVEESVSPEAMAAYENELNLLRDAIAQQRLEVEQMTQQALEAESNAETQAALSKARAALSEVYAALGAGAPYAEQVTTIEANGVAVPAGLAGPAGDGVPTLAALTEDYPPAAREALSEARRLESDAETGTQRFATFLADQVGARSVTPRSGDAPDAILSRAEAALRGGDLQQALTELEALPEEAKAPLTDWMARAQTRVAAVEAADGLAQELNKE